MSVMRQAIQSRIRQDRIVKEAQPFLYMPVTGNNRGTSLVAFSHYLIEIMGRLLCQPFQPEGIDHQKRGRDQADQFPFQ